MIILEFIYWVIFWGVLVMVGLAIGIIFKSLIFGEPLSSDKPSLLYHTADGKPYDPASVLKKKN